MTNRKDGSMTGIALENLSDEQLDELIEEQDDEDGKAALRALKEKRSEMEERLAKGARRAPRTSGPRKPTERHTKASEHFNSVPEKLVRLKEVLAKSVDENGEPIMTPELIRVGIGAYYDQRKRDVEAKKAGLTAAPEPAEVDEENTLPAEAEAVVDETTEESEVGKEVEDNWDDLSLSETPPWAAEDGEDDQDFLDGGEFSVEG